MLTGLKRRGRVWPGETASSMIRCLGSCIALPTSVSFSIQLLSCVVNIAATKKGLRCGDKGCCHPAQGTTARSIHGRQEVLRRQASNSTAPTVSTLPVTQSMLRGWKGATPSSSHTVFSRMLVTYQPCVIPNRITRINSVTNSMWFFAWIEVQTLRTVGPCRRCCGSALGAVTCRNPGPSGGQARRRRLLSGPQLPFSALFLEEAWVGPVGIFSFTNNFPFSVNQLVFFSTSTFASLLVHVSFLSCLSSAHTRFTILIFAYSIQHLSNLYSRLDQPIGFYGVPRLFPSFPSYFVFPL